MDAATVEAIARLCDESAALVQPRPTIGDDDSIYLTERQEGEKAAYLALARTLRSGEFARDD